MNDHYLAKRSHRREQVDDDGRGGRALPSRARIQVLEMHGCYPFITFDIQHTIATAYGNKSRYVHDIYRLTNARVGEIRLSHHIIVYCFSLEMSQIHE